MSAIRHPVIYCPNASRAFRLITEISAMSFARRKSYGRRAHSMCDGAGEVLRPDIYPPDERARKHLIDFLTTIGASGHRHMCKQWNRAGGTALPVTTDITREDQVVQLFKKTYESYGRVDILVNNAGVPTHVPSEDITLKYWQEVLDVNLTGAFLCSREAIKIMKSQTPQGGRIINIGSVSAKTPRPDSLPYTATKFALQGMTHQLTMDGRKYGVVASILHPGATLSSFSTRRGRTTAGPGTTPDDYVMAAEDVAKVVVL